MSNRTYVCLDCKTSRRAPAVYGKVHRLRCPQCCSSGLTELPWERRIPTKTDEAGWQELRVFLVRRAKGPVPPRKSRKEQKPKGVRSLFQLPDSVDALKNKYGPAEVSRYRPDLYPTSYIFKRDGITLTATPFAKLAKKIDIFFEAEQRDSVELLLERYSGRPGWKQLPTTDPAFAKHFPLFNPGGRNSFYSCGDVMALVQRDVGFGKLVFWIQTSDYPDLLAQYRRSKKNA